MLRTGEIVLHRKEHTLFCYPIPSGQHWKQAYMQHYTEWAGCTYILWVFVCITINEKKWPWIWKRVRGGKCGGLDRGKNLYNYIIFS